jgi:hypothetical protein
MHTGARSTSLAKVLVFLLMTVPGAQAQQADQGKAGDVLPIPPPKQEPITEVDWRKVPAPKLFQVQPPAGAPNVIIILMDQLSYADPSAMGGPIHTPTFDEVVKEGLLYTNFYVNALCTPTRMSLITGRNQHLASVSAVVDASTSYPGDTGRRPAAVATVAEIMRNWGYVTGYFGKSHELPPYEYNVSGHTTVGQHMVVGINFMDIWLESSLHSLQTW